MLSLHPELTLCLTAKQKQHNLVSNNEFRIAKISDIHDLFAFISDSVLDWMNIVRDLVGFVTLNSTQLLLQNLVGT